MKQLVILSDGIPLVITDYLDTRMISDLLDEYARVYAIERKGLSGAVVEMVQLPSIKPNRTAYTFLKDRADLMVQVGHAVRCGCITYNGVRSVDTRVTVTAFRRKDGSDKTVIVRIMPARTVMQDKADWYEVPTHLWNGWNHPRQDTWKE